MASFVFIELRDRDINYLFSGIHQILYGNRPDRATHLTIRGPYSGKVPPKTVLNCQEVLKHDVIRIAGTGRFSNPSEEVVYLTVESTHLRSVWWKPDYGIGKYGFNPHISIYRGQSRSFAESLERFFRHENLDLLCSEFRVVTHVTRQLAIFEPRVPTAFIETGRVRPGLLDRLRTLSLRHERRQGTLWEGL